MIYHNIACTWGTTSTSLTGYTASLMQTSGHELQGDKEMMRNGDGTEVASAGYNPNETATFEFIFNAGGAATGSASFTPPAFHQLITVTDTIDTSIAGTNWIVDKVSKKRSNTTALRFTVDCWRNPAITS